MRRWILESGKTCWRNNLYLLTYKVHGALFWGDCSVQSVAGWIWAKSLLLSWFALQLYSERRQHDVTFFILFSCFSECWKIQQSRPACHPWQRNCFPVITHTPTRGLLAGVQHYANIAVISIRLCMQSPALELLEEDKKCRSRFSF